MLVAALALRQVVQYAVVPGVALTKADIQSAADNGLVLATALGGHKLTVCWSMAYQIPYSQAGIGSASEPAAMRSGAVHELMVHSCCWTFPFQQSDWCFTSSAFRFLLWL